MDLESLRTEAIEETAQAFLTKLGYVPDQASEEWEDEYRRQFALAKSRQATKRPSDAAPAPAAAAAAELGLPDLSGPPSEARWAVALRAQRLKEIEAEDIRTWLAGAWVAAKNWI